MDTSQEPTHCEHCGQKIPLRLGPQGRVKRFCSGACRAAASRKRRQEAHQRELEQARTQMALTLHSRDDTAREAAKILREIADAFRSGDSPRATPAVNELVQASYDLVRASMDEQPVAPSPTVTSSRMNRAQRRAKKTSVKNSFLTLVPESTTRF